MSNYRKIMDRSFVLKILFNEELNMVLGPKVHNCIKQIINSVSGIANDTNKHLWFESLLKHLA